ncbi:MAG: ABC transporter substrate-binding protein [Cyanobacterium sp. T60_A2020_053]|nr:ABC transporter substrate-binding protein [Cyanobacterium sp. T60_A2020_053]
MSYLSRRKFILTSSISATGVLLKGCLGDKPESNNENTTQITPLSQTADISPEMMPEINSIRLGYFPIVESAAMIVAQEKGFFAKYGMTKIELVKQPSWAFARDQVVKGGVQGGIDGGQWQMPMPHLITEGIITRGEKIPMYVLAELNTQGNGIAIAGTHAGKGLHLDITKARDYIKSFPRNEGRKFKAAHTFANANQDFWIRYWFASGGINPDTDIDLLAIPPVNTVQGMLDGTMDAFSTGDPWPYRIIAENIGHMGALTSQIWKFHPEEYLAIRADWVDKYPKATKAILKGLMEAQQWCDDVNNQTELISILAQKIYFDVPVDILKPPFNGNYAMGDGQASINDLTMRPLYWKDDLGSVSYPYKSHDLWFLTETLRWGFHRAKLNDFEQIKQLIDRVNREDLWREAATEAGFNSDIPAGTSRGIETFFDGKIFDPENPQAYLDSLTIKNI